MGVHDHARPQDQVGFHRVRDGTAPGTVFLAFMRRSRGIRHGNENEIDGSDVLNETSNSYLNFPHIPSQECAYDHVVLYDGHTTDSKVLGRFCGSKVPHPVGATSDKMLMVFKSDASVQRRGFSAKHMSGE